MRIPPISEQPLKDMSIYIPVSGLRFKITAVDRRSVHTDHPSLRRVDLRQWPIITQHAVLADDDRSILPVFQDAGLSRSMQLACSRVAREVELPKAIADRMGVNEDRLRVYIEAAGFGLDALEARFWIARRRAYRAGSITMDDISRLAGVSNSTSKRRVRALSAGEPNRPLDMPKIKAGILKGTSVVAIARHFGVSRVSLQRWVDRQGGKTVSELIAQQRQERDERIRAMRTAGESYDAIAAELHISKVTAKSRAVAMGVHQ